MKLRLLIAFVLSASALFSQSKEEVALNNQAVNLMDNNKYDEALPYLDKLNEKDTANFIYRYNRAVTLFNLKQYHKAIVEYRFLYQLIPEQSEYIFQIGNAYEQLDSGALAIAYYTEAIVMDSDHFIYFFKRGTQYLKQEKFHQAEADFTSALTLNPSHHNSLHNRGITRFKIGDKTNACEDWCDAFQLGNTYSRTHLSRLCNQVKTCVPEK